MRAGRGPGTAGNGVSEDSEGPNSPNGLSEKVIRQDLWKNASVSILRPSVNVSVVTVRSVNDDLDPPRELYADVAFVWNDQGVVGVLEERADEGMDRLEIRDFLPEDPASRMKVGDDSWIRTTVERWLLGLA